MPSCAMSCLPRSWHRWVTLGIFIYLTYLTQLSKNILTASSAGGNAVFLSSRCILATWFRRNCRAIIGFIACCLPLCDPLPNPWWVDAMQLACWWLSLDILSKRSNKPPPRASTARRRTSWLACRVCTSITVTSASPASCPSVRHCSSNCGRSASAWSLS